MATITRTVMGDIHHTTYVALEGQALVPECITRFSVGTRVEVRQLRGNTYAVQPVNGDPLRVFGEEAWHAAV